MLATVGHNSATRTRCIFRAPGDRGYTKIRNAFLQDRRISDETRGLVARLLSLPDDWEVTVQSIIASGKAGRDKVYRMLKEAETYGYIQPEERHRDDTGKLGRQIYFVSDDPEALINRAAQELYEMEADPYPENPEVDGKPCPAKPDTENTDMVEVVAEQQVPPRPEKPEEAKPDLAEPRLENPHAYKKKIEDKINNNPPIVPPPADEPEKPKRNAIPDQYPYDFEEFWKVYPRREGKAAAFKAWKRLTLTQKRRAYSSLKNQLSILATKAKDRRGNFCPLPATWINQGRFDDEPDEHTAAEPPPSGQQNWRDEERERSAKLREALARAKEKYVG